MIITTDDKETRFNEAKVALENISSSIAMRVNDARNQIRVIDDRITCLLRTSRLIERAIASGDAELIELLGRSIRTGSGLFEDDEEVPF